MAKKCPFCASIHDDSVERCNICGEDLTNVPRYDELSSEYDPYKAKTEQNVVIEEITDDRVYKDPNEKEKRTYTESRKEGTYYSSTGYTDGSYYRPDPSTMNNSGNPNNYYGQPSDKSRIAAGLLQIFLPAFGIGRIYLGYVGIGIAQILLSFFCCGLGIPWGFIDGIYILCGGTKTDADGHRLE